MRVALNLFAGTKRACSLDQPAPKRTKKAMMELTRWGEEMFKHDGVWVEHNCVQSVLRDDLR